MTRQAHQKPGLYDVQNRNHIAVTVADDVMSLHFCISFYICENVDHVALSEKACPLCRIWFITLLRFIYVMVWCI